MLQKVLTSHIRSPAITKPTLSQCYDCQLTVKALSVRVEQQVTKYH